MEDYKTKLLSIQSKLACSNSRLADYLDVDRAQITRWLNGNVPNHDNIVKIDKLYRQLLSSA